MGAIGVPGSSEFDSVGVFKQQPLQDCQDQGISFSRAVDRPRLGGPRHFTFLLQGVELNNSKERFSLWSEQVQEK